MKKNNDLRTRIIKYATEQFFTYGIKDIKMDDIAKGLNISKRTIYEQFDDKNKLLFECLKTASAYLKNLILPQLKDPNKNSLELLLIIYKIYFKIHCKTNKKFIQELFKYPEVQKQREKNEKRNSKIFELWIQKCIEEGLLIKDINKTLTCYIIKHNIEKIIYSDEISQYSIEELGRTFILTHLRGMATLKGIEIIDEYIQNNKYQEL